MTRQSTVRQSSLEAAAEWLMKMQQGELTAEETRHFQQWLMQNEEHPRAWQRAEKLMGRLGELPPAIAQAALDAPKNPARRQAVVKLALLIGAVPLAGSLWYITQQPALFPHHKTAVGERKTLQLDDGTRITLNTNSALDVAFTASDRRVVLHRGEVYLETGKVPDSRPFQVQTPQGVFRPLGTRFSVRLHAETTLLIVQEGAVEATHSSNSRTNNSRMNNPRIVVQQGEQIALTPTSASPISPAGEHGHTWTSGMLLADAMPLARVIETLGRYRRDRLLIAPEIARLAISGAYPLDNTDQALRMLADAYHLKMESRWFGYLTRLAPADR